MGRCRARAPRQEAAQPLVEKARHAGGEQTVGIGPDAEAPEREEGAARAIRAPLGGDIGTEAEPGEDLQELGQAGWKNEALVLIHPDGDRAVGRGHGEEAVQQAELLGAIGDSLELARHEEVLGAPE